MWLNILTCVVFSWIRGPLRFTYSRVLSFVRRGYQIWQYRYCELLPLLFRARVLLRYIGPFFERQILGPIPCTARQDSFRIVFEDDSFERCLSAWHVFKGIARCALVVQINRDSLSAASRSRVVASLVALHMLRSISSSLRSFSQCSSGNNSLGVTVSSSK